MSNMKTWIISNYPLRVTIIPAASYSAKYQTQNKIHILTANLLPENYPLMHEQ